MTLSTTGIIIAAGIMFDLKGLELPFWESYKYVVVVSTALTIVLYTFLDASRFCVVPKKLSARY